MKMCSHLFTSLKIVNISKFCTKIENPLTFNVTKHSFAMCRTYSKDVSAENAESFDFASDDESEHVLAELERKRDKSGLNVQHRNIINNRVPYDEPVAWFHHTVKYKRRLIARYGLDAVDDPLGMMWPTKEELQDQREFDQCYRPESLQEMVTKARGQRLAEEKVIQERQDKIAEKLAKLGQWKKEFHARVEKKAKEAELARLKKERLVEEVRRHFGFKVDPREDKFKEMLEQKEKQERKIEKEARKKARQDKMMQKILDKQGSTEPATAEAQ